MKCIEDEIPFELPEGWEWTRLQVICEPITDGTHKTPTYSDEGFIFLSSKNVTSGHIDWDNIMYIPESLHNELYARLAPQKNDILLAKNGTTGVAAIVDRDCIFDIYVSLALLRIIGYIISPEYLLSTIASSTIQNYFNSSLKGIGVPNLHLEHIRTTLIPVAPINEQYRIATKLEQLLSFADNIETDKTDLQTTIQLAKSKILDLAIRGKLVPQNPDDEPASVLLDRIRAEKEELIKQGKIKRDKKESVIFRGEDNSYYEKIGNTVTCIDEELPFELPKSWEWCNLSMVGQTNIGLTYSPADIVPDNGTIVFRSSNIINNQLDYSDLVRVNKSIRDNQYLANNDILICARNGSKALVGKCALIKNLSERASFGAFMAIYRTTFYTYVFYFLQTSIFRDTFHDSNSTAINQLTQAMIKKTRIPLPPFEEQLRIVEYLNKYFDLLNYIEKSLN